MKNKILKDEEIFILDNREFSLTVTGNNKIFIPDVENIDISIELVDNATLDLYIYTSKDTKNKIIINEHNNTKLNVYHSFCIHETYSLILNSNILGNNNISNVFLSGIAYGDVILNLDGDIASTTKDNEFNESIRVLTRGGKVKTLPILHVSTKNCNARHGNSISNINEDYLFYLMTKGISRDKATELIEKSYILGLFKNAEEFKKLINI